MIPSGRRGRPAVYELTIVGPLGPVLRRALEPLATAASGHQTTLRAGPREEADLADLLRSLESQGLEVVDVSVVAARLT